MKIQIENKTIRIEGANMGELYDFILRAFPDQWRDFTIESVPTIQNWNYPIYVPYNPPYWTYGELPLWINGDYTMPTIYTGANVLNLEVENQNTTFEPAY